MGPTIFLRQILGMAVMRHIMGPTIFLRQILGMAVLRVEYNHHQEAKLACPCWRVTQMPCLHI
jgi:hypothetical protein